MLGWLQQEAPLLLIELSEQSSHFATANSMAKLSSGRYQTSKG